MLDTKLNRVVGLVSARYFPKGWIKGNISYAVDNRVLTFNPFLFTLQNEPNPLRPAPEPRIDKAEARAAVAKDLGLAWNNAPPSLAEWVGRKGLLGSITEDWTDSKKRLTGLIGFGGEGKSSLARRWVDDLLNDKSLPQPDGVFWWGFYDKPSTDEFFEMALNYMGGGKLDKNQYNSSSSRAHLIAAMLHTGRYLFILDGLEVLQHQEGDQYGLLKSNDLHEFLEYFAAPSHRSFCLVTSRAPLLDLMEYTTYRDCDVEHLSKAEGLALLEKLGVKGSNKELGKIVSDWDGHALTLSLLASYLLEFYGGDAGYIGEIPSPTANESRYERINRILRRYDEHLSKTERAFLLIFSAFRKSIQESSFDWVFRVKIGTKSLNASISALHHSEFDSMLTRLIRYRIIRCNPDSKSYTAHPLIRNYYYLHLIESGYKKSIHEIIMYYYLTISKAPPFDPTIEDFAPQIEAVYHACRSARYRDAITIYWEQISHKDLFLPLKLSYENTMLELVREFFPNGDYYQEPLTSNLEIKGGLLNIIGICLMNTGYLKEALFFHERGNSIFFNMDRRLGFINLGNNYQNLTELNVHLGQLEVGDDYASKILIIAYLVRDNASNILKLLSYIWRARILYLKGELDTIGLTFQRLEDLEKSLFHYDHLTSNRGIFYAEYLRRIHNYDYAKHVTKYNLEIMKSEICLPDISRCYRVLGDLEADSGRHDFAHANYKESLKIARKISRSDILIEVLSSRGRWAAQRGNVEIAFDDLNEALNYSTLGGYCIYEADIRVGLAWAHLAANDKVRAIAEAKRAKEMSDAIGYHWGKVDADEVLREVASQEALHAGRER